MKNFFFVYFLIFLHCINCGYAQTLTPPSIQWERCYGGTEDDIAYSIKQTVDGGFIVAGNAASSDGDILKPGDIQHGGDYDYWITKLDPASNIQWKQHLGGTDNDAARVVLQTVDGGYIVGGSSESYDLDVYGNHGNHDYWIVKLIASGTVEWSKCLGGTSFDFCRDLKATPDGGYIIFGNSQSNDGDVSGNQGYSDYWLVKTDGSANIQWQKSYGGSGSELASKIILTADGGFLMAGLSESNDGDVSGNHGDYDGLLIKINAGGDIEWQKCLGGGNYDEITDVIQLDDGSFHMTGTTASNDGDVSGNHGGSDVWIVKTDISGNILWQHSYGGSETDSPFSMAHNYEGGWLIGSYTNSGDGDVTDSLGDFDYWILNTDSTGNILWQKSYGGSSKDVCYSVVNTADEGFALAGYSESYDGMVTGNHGLSRKDYWIVRLAGLVGIEETLQEDMVHVSPNPVTDAIHITTDFPKKCEVSLLDIYGRIIYTATILQSATIDVDNFADGVYFLEIKNEDVKVVRQWLKQ